MNSLKKKHWKTILNYNDMAKLKGASFVDKLEGFYHNTYHFILRQGTLSSGLRILRIYLLYDYYHNPFLITNRSWILTVHKDRNFWKKTPWKQRNGLEKWDKKYASL